MADPLVSAHDTASYILQKAGKMTAMKLQKLLYYSQAWSLVWDERPLFRERIQAWANGPVVREVYDIHRGQFDVESWPEGRPEALDGSARDTVDAVVRYYGPMSAQQLSDMTHLEEPWSLARRGLEPAARGNAEITHASMAEYYSSLPPTNGEERQEATA